LIVVVGRMLQLRLSVIVAVIVGSRFGVPRLHIMIIASSPPISRG